MQETSSRFIVRFLIQRFRGEPIHGHSGAHAGQPRLRTFMSEQCKHAIWCCIRTNQFIVCPGSRPPSLIYDGDGNASVRYCCHSCSGRYLEHECNSSDFNVARRNMQYWPQDKIPEPSCGLRRDAGCFINLPAIEVYFGLREPSKQSHRKSR